MPRRRELLQIGAGLSGIAAVVLALRWLQVTNTTTVALALLVIVLWTAAASRLWIAVVCSIAAMLAVNFFFMPPVGTFKIADPQNWVALLVFLVVGFVGSQLSASAQARARDAIALVSERKEAELMRQKAELASTLLATLSHDLRTPLTAIGVAVENLQKPQLPAAERAEQGRLALFELERLNRLFRDILDMARIDAAALTVERDWITPADIIDAALSHLRPTLDRRVLNIDADAATAVYVDPRLTSGALAHLIDNAAQYSPPDRPIELWGSVDDAGLRLVVRDHGPGLDPEERDQVFEPFFRGRTARQQALGTGMGLAITRGLVAAEEGRVWGENAAGGGAEFTLLVPGRSHAVMTEQDA